MRPLEWLTLLAFLPALLLPLFPRSTLRRGALDLAALLPLLATAAQVLLEGWRAQMVPLYLVAALFVVSRLRARRWAASSAPPHPVRLGGTVLTLALAGALPAWLLPVVTLPPPTGPYAVGVVDREIRDPVRKRCLMVSVWYPASKAGTRAPLTHDPGKVAAGLASSYGVPVAAVLLQHLRYFTSAASPAAPILRGVPPFPVLVFSHGLMGLRLQNSETFQELASRGYVVVALDHTDAAAVTVFPDGETRLFNLRRLGIRSEDHEAPGRSLLTALLPIWVADQRRVYDTLTAWAATDPTFAGQLDLGQMGSFGHSFGGVTALEVCRVEVRCRAAANLDGGLPPGGLPPAVRPVLLMTSAQSNSFGYAIRRWTRYIGSAKTSAVWLELPGSNHYSFTIVPRLTPLGAPWGYDPAAGSRTVNRYLNAFFDLHLRGVPTRLFDATPQDRANEARAGAVRTRLLQNAK